MLRTRHGIQPFLVILIAFLLAAGGCVKRPPKGISLQNVDSDIAFGVKSPEPAPPANASAPRNVEAEDDNFNESAFRRRFSGPPARASQTCPPAPVGAAAPREAPLNAEGMPPEGSYRWKTEGSIQPTGSPFKVPVSGFERREIRKVERISDTAFRFEMLQPDLATSDVVGTTYRVRTAAASARPPGVPDQRTGEPDRGMSIERIEYYDAKTGQPKGQVFRPNPAVLQLPLPVFPGERFQATGVDASSRRSLTVDGFVPKRELVDACGQLIDGWKIEMTRSFTGSATQKYRLIVATQKGALPLSEFIEYQDANGAVSITYTIGQVEPDPAGGGS